MRNLLFLCLGVLCVLGSSSVEAVSGDQPTTGGDPVFATSTDVKLSTIRSLIEAKDFQTAEQLANDFSLFPETEAPVDRNIRGLLSAWRIENQLNLLHKLHLIYYIVLSMYRSHLS